MTRVGILTQARTGSTRLPGKVLLPLGEGTVLRHHLARAATSGLPVVVATSDRPADDAVAQEASRCGVPHVRGSEHDVLDRFARAAAADRLDVVVRVTSDCPLIDGALVARAVRTWLAVDDPWAYVSTGLQRTYPRGFDVEVFGGPALQVAARSATRAADREHVTPWFYRGGDPRVRPVALTQERDDSDLRVTLDTADDLRLLRALVEDHGALGLDLDGIVGLLRSRPDLVALNAHVEQKPLDGLAASGT